MLVTLTFSIFFFTPTIRSLFLGVTVALPVAFTIVRVVVFPVIRANGLVAISVSDEASPFTGTFGGVWVWFGRGVVGRFVNDKSHVPLVSLVVKVVTGGVIGCRCKAFKIYEGDCCQ